MDRGKIEADLRKTIETEALGKMLNVMETLGVVGGKFQDILAASAIRTREFIGKPDKDSYNINEWERTLIIDVSRCDHSVYVQLDNKFNCTATTGGAISLEGHKTFKIISADPATPCTLCDIPLKLINKSMFIAI